MTAYELLDISLSLGNRIDVQWTLFITVHLALFGGIIYVDRPLRRLEKISALTIYGCFGILNYRVLLLQIELLGGVYQDLAQLAMEPCCNSSQLLRSIVDDVAANRLAYTEIFLLGGHALMALLVIVAIHFDRSFGSKN